MTDPSLPAPASVLASEITVSYQDQVFPGHPLGDGLALVLFCENALNAESVGIHVGDVIELDGDVAVRTVARNHPYQSRFLLVWDEDPSPVDRVVAAISHHGGKCIGYLPEQRVLVVLHDQPLIFPSPPGVLVVASYPHDQRLP